MGWAAQVSGVADGYLGSDLLYGVSAGLLVLASAALLGWDRHRRAWVLQLTPLVYLVSATLLILSQRNSTTGLTVIVLIQVLSVAVRGTWVQSGITVALMTLAIVVIFASHQSDFVVIARVLVLWAAMGLVVSAVIHQLRARLTEANAELAHLAVSDPLTGLANRRGFDQAVLARRGRRDFAVLAIDVDGLKAMNDRYGHEAGDELLRAVGMALSGIARAGDVVARVGGDEFEVFISDVTRGDEEAAAARMHQAVAALQVRGHPVRISIGSAVGGAGTSIDELMHEADTAMYAQKRKTKERSGRVRGPV